MRLEEVLRALHVLLFEQSRIGPAEQRGADAAAEHITDLVAEDRGDEAAHEQDGQVETGLVLGGQQARGEEQRVAGQEEPDEQPRLGEDDQQQADRGPGPEPVDDLLGVEEVESGEDNRHSGTIDAVTCSGRTGTF